MSPRWMPPVSKPARQFSPWREDFYAAAGFAALAAVALWLGFANGSLRGILLALVVAALCLAAARFAWRNGMRRWYGKDLERWAVASLGRLLDVRGISWESGRLVRGCGDVNLLATPSKGPVVVEITSFERWGRGWFGMPTERDKEALAQVGAQVDAVGAVQGYLWLPRGRASLLQRLVLRLAGGQVRVVIGSERVMARKVFGHHSRRDALVASIRGRR